LLRGTNGQVSCGSFSPYIDIAYFSAQPIIFFILFTLCTI
jgi:hypothetical protein